MERLIRVIDTETTGLDETARLIEVAAVDWRPDCSELAFASFVAAPGPIPAAAKAIHHITEAMLDGAPTWADVMPQLIGAPIYAAHNADFDKRFVPELTVAPWICTRKVALRAIEDAPSYSLQVLRYHLDLGLPAEAGEVPHRAIYDAWTCERLLAWFFAQGWTAQKMVAVSKEPAVLRRIPFSKHRNKAFADIDDGWLDWAVSSCEDAEVKHTARMEIARRRGELVT